MKHYNCDWVMIKKYNNWWEKLPSGSRKFFLEKFNDSSIIVPMNKTPECTALIKNGFIKYNGINMGLRVVQARKKFHQAVCSMNKFQLFSSDNPSTETLINYIKNNYSQTAAVLPLSENLSHHWKYLKTVENS